MVGVKVDRQIESGSFIKGRRRSHATFHREKKKQLFRSVLHKQSATKKLTKREIIVEESNYWSFNPGPAKMNAPNSQSVRKLNHTSHCFSMKHVAAMP